MTPIGLIITLNGFVFGFSLGHILLRIGGLAIERDRVQFSGLGILTIVSAILLVLSNWLSLYDFHDKQQWALIEIVSIFCRGTKYLFYLHDISPASAVRRRGHGSFLLEPAQGALVGLGMR